MTNARARANPDEYVAAYLAVAEITRRARGADERAGGAPAALGGGDPSPPEEANPRAAEKNSAAAAAPGILAAAYVLLGRHRAPRRPALRGSRNRQPGRRSSASLRGRGGARVAAARAFAHDVVARLARDGSGALAAPRSRLGSRRRRSKTRSIREAAGSRRCSATAAPSPTRGLSSRGARRWSPRAPSWGASRGRRAPRARRRRARSFSSAEKKFEKKHAASPRHRTRRTRRMNRAVVRSLTARSPGRSRRRRRVTRARDPPVRFRRRRRGAGLGARPLVCWRGTERRCSPRRGTRRRGFATPRRGRSRPRRGRGARSLPGRRAMTRRRSRETRTRKGRGTRTGRRLFCPVVRARGPRRTSPARARNARSDPAAAFRRRVPSRLRRGIPRRRRLPRLAPMTRRSEASRGSRRRFGQDPPGVAFDVVRASRSRTRGNARGRVRRGSRRATRALGEMGAAARGTLAEMLRASARRTPG